ncbi:hypothetical protein LXA43DRAFT_844468, partial [Ganoderma leucocontextum]
LYADRRFERDRCFPFIAFSQEQIRKSTQGGYLLTARKNFNNVADKILNIDRNALDSIINRLGTKDLVRAETEGEKACLELLSIVDHVAGHVQGSVTSRKYQRNELKSLIIAKGVPVFFVTFAPADFKNPLCLLYCGEEINLLERHPQLRSCNDRLRALADHPASAARFFDRVVRNFLTHILRVDTSEPGLFGQTDTYYGTVE